MKLQPDTTDRFALRCLQIDLAGIKDPLAKLRRLVGYGFVLCGELWSQVGIIPYGEHSLQPQTTHSVIRPVHNDNSHSRRLQASELTTCITRSPAQVRTVCMRGEGAT